MNKLKTVLLILFAIVILILVFFLFKNLNKENNNTANNKIISEVKYIDNKLNSLLNAMNNINLENYKISISKTSTSTNSQQQGSSSGGQEGGSNSGGNSESEEGSQGQSGESSGGSQGSSGSGKSTVTEEYALQSSGILSNNSNTDWQSIKNEVEIFYYTLPTVTLDLYSMNVDNNEILNFNKELDSLTVAVKEENKEASLSNLSSLYSYLPKYAKNLGMDELYTNLLETKSSVYNAYALLDTNNWQEVLNNIKKAEETFTKIVNNMEDYNQKTDSINKIYIILNELENAANLQDRDIFLIKYKTFLDEAEMII